MKKTFRICLLIGLILSLALFAYYTISSFIGMTAVFSILGTVGADPTFNAAGAITIGIMVLMTIFGLLGVIFSAISFTRVGMDPEKFANKKGLPITIVVFDFILAFFILVGFASGFDVLSLFCLFGFIAAAVLILVDIVKNKKLIENPAPISEEQKPEETKVD